ncbi:MAG: DUF4139 domain-containing protein [Treponema sp.]|jgi:hypothetical protein|nr:DUF4139 domain-containing protein [Treponema sp.]
MRTITGVAIAAVFLAAGGNLLPAGGTSGLFAQAQNSSGAELPLRRVAVFSSGVGYFEHGGTVSGQAGIRLPFDVDAVNDALKSLMINDPAQGASPVVSYPSEETLEKTLKSLGVDLSENPGTAEIFAAQRGAEIEISAPNSINGRIAGVERRANGENDDVFLSLYTNGSLKLIALKDIGSFAFKDPALNADLERALDLIAANRASRTRNLFVTLNAASPGRRDVSLSYVIPVPIWKVSYRLDLGQSAPLFQGWAIVDNGSDSDWNNVELSLVAGRPVSFIQALYPPYYLARPFEPLSIAGTARAQSYAPGYESADFAADIFADEEYGGQNAARSALQKEAASASAPVPAERSRAAGGSVVAAAAGGAAGDQFSFTINKPVTLLRRQSAMLPLVDGRLTAVKTLILSGTPNGSVHPRLGAEITNTTGMKLPAGPITVYDGGVYAGDALIEFFSENDKRFISYGEDLSVTASVKYSNTRFTGVVTVTGGVMTINRRLVYERTYTVKNAGAETKRLIVEHPVTGGAVLAEPKTYLEKTDSLYRFVQNLPGGGEAAFTVKEELPLSERIVLAQLGENSFAAYASNQEIPANVRAALSRAVELRQKADAARQALTELQNRKTRLAAEQDRIRQNLAAVGNETEPGRNYLTRMTGLDREIDGVNEEIVNAEKLVQTTRADLDAYIAGLNLQ